MNLAAESLKSAIECGDFERALASIENYGSDVRGELKEADTREAHLAIMQESLAFLQDRLHLARVMRAHIASQLAVVSRLSSYGSSPNCQSTWNVEG